MEKSCRMPDFFRNFHECSTEAARRGQDERGLRMARKYEGQVQYSWERFSYFEAEWITPKGKWDPNVILYFHGGGYVAGSLLYARGLGTALAVKNQCRVFSVGYRLAPEYPYPAALQDGITAYQYLLNENISSKNIILAGESSGGGQAFAVSLKIRDLGLPMPKGIIAFSPWTDMTCSGASYDQNKEKDPSLEKEVLEYYASLYTSNPKGPYVSPLWADLNDLPPVLLFAGGDEILLSDSQSLCDRLRKANVPVQLEIAPGMWHAYILYGGRKSMEDYEIIKRFIKRI